MPWLATPDDSPGRPAVFCAAAIQFCPTIKAVLKRPLRQSTGMVASLLKCDDLDWTMSYYSNQFRRQKTLAAQISFRRSNGPISIELLPNSWTDFRVI